MSLLFFIGLVIIGRWCTFPMTLLELTLTAATTTGGSFVGAALFWYIQCPNRRCCQLSTVREVLERRKE